MKRRADGPRLVEDLFREYPEFAEYAEERFPDELASAQFVFSLYGAFLAERVDEDPTDASLIPYFAVVNAMAGSSDASTRKLLRAVCLALAETPERVEAADRFLDPGAQRLVRDVRVDDSEWWYGDWWPGSIEAHVILMTMFVDGRITAAELEALYLPVFSADPVVHPDPVFDVLERVFFSVDALCLDEAQRTAGEDLDGDALLEVTQAALEELHQVAPFSRLRQLGSMALEMLRGRGVRARAAKWRAAAGEPEPTDREESIDAPALTTSVEQIEKKYGQAWTLGVRRPSGRAGFEDMTRALERVVAADDVRRRPGTLRGRDVVLHVCPVPNVIVAQSPAGGFVTCWAPCEQQWRRLVRDGRLDVG